MALLPPETGGWRWGTFGGTQDACWVDAAEPGARSPGSSALGADSLGVLCWAGLVPVSCALAGGVQAGGSVNALFFFFLFCVSFVFLTF